MRRFEHKIIDGVEHRRCSYHKKYEPIENFSDENGRWDLQQAYCKEGKSDYQKEYYRNRTDYVGRLET